VIDSLTVRFSMAANPDPLFGWSQIPPVPRHLLESVPAAEPRRGARAWNERRFRGL
jgi:hypothetical protein